MRVADLKSIKMRLASPEDILSWSYGEVIKPETVNYRTQRAEKDGLFCEKIFGPEKDYQCYCGKYRGIKYKGITCDRCGVEITKSQVRRERMGHIKLATPCSHIWFLRGVPSRMSLVLDIPMQQLEKVIYFAAYIVTKVDEEAKKKVLEEIEKEYQRKLKGQKSPKDTASKLGAGPTGQVKLKNKVKLRELKAARDKAKEKILSTKPLKILSEVEYYNLSLKYGQIFEAGTGAEALRKIFEKIDIKKEIKILENEAKKTASVNRKKILRRLKFFKNMPRARIRPEWMFLTVLPVLPPDLRPMVQLDGGRFASSDLNDLYRRVINRNNRLKYLLEINAPEVIIRNEKRMLQEAIDALIDNGMRKGTTTIATTGGRRLLKSLANMLEGKQGRFRQNLLGKRVDYSGRSVIVVGPELKLNQVGIPKRMALELFKPFIIKKILKKEQAYNVRSASRLIDEETAEVWENLEEVVEDKLVLLNRAPTLHKLGVQAFYPVLIEGEAIRIHPLVCKAFNADFDGDQMAVYLPLSEEAQREAKEIMLSSLNLLKPATGLSVATLNQDIILGCYWLTKIIEEPKEEIHIFGTSGEALMSYEFGQVGLKEKIKVRLQPAYHPSTRSDSPGFLETSVGRIVFNENLPLDYPFQNKEIRMKDLEKIAGDIIEKYSSGKTEEILDKIKNLGFEYSTLSGITWGIDDLIVPPEKQSIIQEAEKEIDQIEGHFHKGLLSSEERNNKIIEVWTKTKTKIEKLVPKTLPKLGSVFSIIDSGAKGSSWSQTVQMTGMKGLVTNPAGQIIRLPVKSSYKEGFNVLEYFIATHGARKGTADTALRTSSAGYLTRRLVDVAHEVIISEEDCKDEEGITIFKRDADDIGQNFLFKIVGRVTLEDIKNPKSKTKIIKKGEIIDWKKGEKIIELGINQIRVRSPLTCKIARGICRKCYGWDFGNNQMVKLGEAVGVVAAQAIGEPGTQLTLRTFHTGGVAGGGDITSGLPRVQEVFEVRIPGGKAEISQVEGKVLEITPERIVRIKSTQSSDRVPPRTTGKSPRASRKKAEIVEYKIPPNAAIWVKPDQIIKKGEQLYEGSLDLRELFRLTDSKETQHYIIKEIQKIYVSQGAIIHDKHIEIIVRQMFSRVKIKDLGESSFNPSEVVEKARFLEENALLKKEKRKLSKAVPVLLGISKVALTTDSFLSAASFQETSRVLIRAAIEGKEDKLRGLKENVIIGKLIPAGTGFKK